MSARRIKKKPSGPLDWIRTDDRSMVEYFYVLLMTRGLYPVLEALHEALRMEAEASSTEKAAVQSAWLVNADFCRSAAELLANVATELQYKWNSEDEKQLPNTARRKQPVVGAVYPLPGGGLYVPKRTFP